MGCLISSILYLKIVSMNGIPIYHTIFDLRQEDVLGSFSFLLADTLTRFTLGQKNATLFFVTLITITRKTEFQ